MPNQLFKFNNGYEGIIHINSGYQAAPYHNNTMYKLNAYTNVFKAIEQAGLFRSGLSQSESHDIAMSSNVRMDGLLESNTVMNVRQNLITMLYRLSEAHPLVTYFDDRRKELTKKWNIQPILS